MLKIILCGLILIGCETRQDSEKEDLQYRKDAIQGLRYTKDSRTGLCYASTYLRSHASVITNVPCTAEVEKHLDK